MKHLENCNLRDASGKILNFLFQVNDCLWGTLITASDIKELLNAPETAGRLKVLICSKQSAINGSTQLPAAAPSVTEQR